MTKLLWIFSADQWFSNGESFLKVRQGSYGSFEASWGKSYVLHQESSTSGGKHFATCLSVSLLASEGLFASLQSVSLGKHLNCISVASRQQKHCRVRKRLRSTHCGMKYVKVYVTRKFLLRIFLATYEACFHTVETPFQSYIDSLPYTFLPSLSKE